MCVFACVCVCVCVCVCETVCVCLSLGFSKVVELLLQHGATTALLDGGGQLVVCPQYEGVRMQIESHRLQHTRDIVTHITDRSKKNLEQLQKIWLVSRLYFNLQSIKVVTVLYV